MSVTLFAQSAVADMIVCPSGCSYGSIQDAIDDAPDGERIRIRPGIYEENLVITDKRLRLVGSGSAVTVIDGTASPGSRVISLNCSTKKMVVIDDVTIMGGNPDRGFGGGGIKNAGCKAALNNCLITGNAARAGGGILNAGTMSIWNTVVSNNSAFDLGGGAILNEGTLDITKTQVVNNSARSGGGGISNGGTLTAKNVTLANNRARLGGGVANANDAKGSLVGASIVNNDASQKGGGVYNVQDLKIKYSLVLSNTAGDGTAGKGGGLYNGGEGNLKLVGDFVARNVAQKTGSDGGGLFNEAGGLVILSEGTTLVNNDPNDCVGCP